MRDINEIAYRILRLSINTEPRSGETFGARVARENSAAFGQLARMGGLASAAKVPLETRRANGIKGALARWGTFKEIIPPMPASRKNLDMNQLAKRILDEATGDEPKTDAPQKNQAAVELGRLGGKKGGAARKNALTPEQRSEIAKKAATKRWTKEQ